MIAAGLTEKNRKVFSGVDRLEGRLDFGYIGGEVINIETQWRGMIINK
jgi:hypothetical protein